MAESSSQNPPSPNKIPKEEPVTYEKPESPNPFLPADKVNYDFDAITLAANNEVALLYLEHPNSQYFKPVSDFISNCCLKEAFTRAPNQYVEYLAEFWVKVDFSKIIWDDLLQKLNKKTREKVAPYYRFISILLEYMMPEYDDESLTLLPTEVFSVSSDQQAPNTSSQAEKKVSQGKKPEAKRGLRKQSSKDTFESQLEATKSKTGHFPKETQSSSAKDTNPTQPSSFTPMVNELHKEAQQAAGGSTSLGATSKEGDHPQLSSDKTKSTRDGLNTVQTDTVPPPSPTSILIQELQAQVQKLQSQKLQLEQEKAQAEVEAVSLRSQSKYPDINKLTELLVTSLKLEVSKLLTTHDFSNFIPTELKTLPLKITELSGEVAEVKDIQWKPELDFLNLPRQGEKNTNQATISQLFQRKFAKDAEKANLKQPTTKTPPTFKSPFSPSPSSIPPQTKGEPIKKNKGKSTMPSNKDEEEETKSDSEDEYANLGDLIVESSRKQKVKKFDFVTKEGEHVHLTAEKIKEQKRIEKSLKANLAEHNEEKVEQLIDLMGYDIVAKYYKNKLLYDKYCDQMLNRRKSSKITNYEILTKRGPITLKVHREDGNTEVIPNFKTSDLNLAEWKEFMSLKRTSSYTTEVSSVSILQFSLVDNSKLNDVYLLLGRLKHSFTSRRFTRREKDYSISKRNKIPLSKKGKIKLEGDNTPVVIQPPCPSIGK
ncbi:hypothetical protein Tco_0833402, partial [Tanacetum coccineum]